MVYVETQESWEIIIKHAEGNNYLICTDILWDPERFRKYRLVTRASLTKVGTLVKLRTNYGDRLFGPFLQSNFQSHERQHDLLPMCMMSLVSVSFLSSQKITVAVVEGLQWARPAECWVELRRRRVPQFLLQPSSTAPELQCVLGILLRAAAPGGIAGAPGGGFM